MPRLKRPFDKHFVVKASSITDELAGELKSDREFGQPLIKEEEFVGGRLRVIVFWDLWEKLTHEDRSNKIIGAYRMAESKEFADRITLATGLTFPEAYASGMLVFQIIAALRKTDEVTREQCRQAMIEEGASLLFDPERPQLRFETEQEAEACLKRLATRLPGSEPVWQILQEAGQNLDLSSNDSV